MFIWNLLVFFLVAFQACPVTSAGKNKDFYDILGVPKNATNEQIGKAYRDLSLKYHPDKNPDNKDSQDNYLRINEAYDTLSDENKRRQYDQVGPNYQKAQGNYQGGEEYDSPFDIFRSFMGGSGGQYQKPKGTDVQTTLGVDLEDIFKGSQKIVEYSRNILCMECKGTGAKNTRDIVQCGQCRGQGRVFVRREMGPGMIVQTTSTCNQCNGTGQTYGPNCTVCTGKGFSKSQVKKSFQIPVGSPSRFTLVMTGGGNEMPNGVSGDLRIEIVQRPHPVFFKRAGPDLFITETINLNEAINGFIHQVSHLDGSNLKIERNIVTQPNLVVRMADKGMPTQGRPSKRGSLYITFQVILPFTKESFVQQFVSKKDQEEWEL